MALHVNPIKKFIHKQTCSTQIDYEEFWQHCGINIHLAELQELRCLQRIGSPSISLQIDTWTNTYKVVFFTTLENSFSFNETQWLILITMSILGPEHNCLNSQHQTTLRIVFFNIRRCTNIPCLEIEILIVNIISSHSLQKTI